jgi:hypothetical protein
LSNSIIERSLRKPLFLLKEFIMKTIRKNFLLLAFAAGALFLIGNNVMADPTVPIQEPPQDNGRGPMCYDSNGKAGCKMITGFCSDSAKANC